MTHRKSYTAKALEKVTVERTWQDYKWGRPKHEDGTGDKYKELAKKYNINHKRDITWADIFLEEVFEALSESNKEALERELIQVAAVTVAWIESLLENKDQLPSVAKTILSEPVLSDTKK